MQPDSPVPPVVSQPTQPIVAPVAQPFPQQVQQQVQTSPIQSQVIYAGFWRRFLAFFIDILIVETIGFLVSLFFGQVGRLSSDSIGFNLSGTPANILYILVLVVDILLTGKFGQTPGKMISKIRVVKVGTGSHPNYVEAFLRELIGKFISTLAFLLGFLWMLWDPQKQTWHDKIAGTVVVKT